MTQADASGATPRRAMAAGEGTGVGLAIGVNLCLLVGPMLRNVGLGIALGAALRLLFGGAFDARRRLRQTGRETQA